MRGRTSHPQHAQSLPTPAHSPETTGPAPGSATSKPVNAHTGQKASDRPPSIMSAPGASGAMPDPRLLPHTYRPADDPLRAGSLPPALDRTGHDPSSMEWSHASPAPGFRQSQEVHGPQSEASGIAASRHDRPHQTPPGGPYATGSSLGGSPDSPQAKRQKFVTVSDLVDMDPGPTPSPAPKGPVSSTSSGAPGASSASPMSGVELASSNTMLAGGPGLQRLALGEADVEDLMELAHQASLLPAGKSPVFPQL